MAKLEDLVNQFNAEAAKDEHVESWIPARLVITDGVLGVSKTGIAFLSAKRSDLKVEQWPFEVVRDIRIVSSKVAPQVAIVLKRRNLYFRVSELKNAEAFKSATEKIAQSGEDTESGSAHANLGDREMRDDISGSDASGSGLAERGVPKIPKIPKIPEIPKVPEILYSETPYTRTPKIIGCMIAMVGLAIAGWYVWSGVIAVREFTAYKTKKGESRETGRHQPPESRTKQPGKKEAASVKARYRMAERTLERDQIQCHSFEIGANTRIRTIEVPMADLSADNVSAYPAIRIYTDRVNRNNRHHPNFAIAEPVAEKIRKSGDEMERPRKDVYVIDYEFAHGTILKSGMYWIVLEPDPNGRTDHICLVKDDRANAGKQNVVAYDKETDRWIRSRSKIAFNVVGEEAGSEPVLFPEAMPGVRLARSVYYEKRRPFGIALGPKGRLAAIGQGAVCIWNGEDGTLAGEVAVKTSFTSLPIRFDPDGNTLVWADKSTVSLMPIDSPGKIRNLKGRGQRILAMDISPDGKTIVTGKFNGDIDIWNVAEGVCQRTINGHGRPVAAIAFHPEGKLFASGGKDLNIRVWTIGGNEKAALKAHWDEVAALDFSPGGNMLASGDIAGEIHVWNMSEYRLDKSVRASEKPLGSLVFAPDGKTLFSGGGNRTIHLFDASEGVGLGSFPTHSRLVKNDYSEPVRLAMRPDGRMLASAAGGRAIGLWTPEYAGIRENRRPEEERVEKNQNPPVMKVNSHIAEKSKFHGKIAIARHSAISREGRLAIAGKTGEIELRDTDSRLLGVYKTKLERVNCVDISPNGKLFAVGGQGGISVRRVKDGTDVAKFGKRPSVYSLRFGPDSRKLAIGFGNKTVSVWDVGNGREAYFEARVKSSAEYLVFSPDGKFLASGGGPPNVWDIAQKKRIELFEGTAGFVDFGSDGKTFMAATPEGFKIADMTAGKEIGGFKFPRTMGRIMCLELHGGILAAGVYKGILLWDIAEKRPLMAFKGTHFANIRNLAFTDSGTLVSLAENNTVKVWAVDIDGMKKHTDTAGERTVLFKTGDAPVDSTIVFNPVSLPNVLCKFELEQYSKVDAIEIHVTGIDIVNPHAFPVMRVGQNDRIIAASVSADIKSAFMDSANSRLLDYWIRYGFQDDLILEKGVYTIHLAFENPDLAGKIGFRKAEGGRKQYLFRIFGKILEKSHE